MTTWIFDSSIVDRLSQHDKKIHQVAEDLGYPTIMVNTSSAGFVELPEFPPVVDSYVLYGSHKLVRTLLKEYPWLTYAAFGVNDRTMATSYLSNLPTEWFLNDNAVFMPWRLLKHRGAAGFPGYQSGLFIRPNSGFKTFAGQTIMFDNWQHTIDLLEDVSSVVDETLILVSPLQEIMGEFRFVVAGGRVITGSEYRWDDKLDIRIDYPEECLALAQQVAQHDWQVDNAYVVDVALTQHGPRVIELNSFSCAGLYACDLEKIVKAVSIEAENTWSDIDAIHTST